MHDKSALETLEGLSNVFARVPCTKSELGQSSIPWLMLVMLGIAHCSQQGRLVHCQSIIKHSIKMDYTSTLETIEDFWMTLSWCSKHQVSAWAILYPLVKVSNAGNCRW